MVQKKSKKGKKESEKVTKKSKKGKNNNTSSFPTIASEVKTRYSNRYIITGLGPDGFMRLSPELQTQIEGIFLDFFNNFWLEYGSRDDIEFGFVNIVEGSYELLSSAIIMNVDATCKRRSCPEQPIPMEDSIRTRFLEDLAEALDNELINNSITEVHIEVEPNVAGAVNGEVDCLAEENCEGSSLGTCCGFSPERQCVCQGSLCRQNCSLFDCSRSMFCSLFGRCVETGCALDECSELFYCSPYYSNNPGEIYYGY